MKRAALVGLILFVVVAVIVAGVWYWKDGKSVELNNLKYPENSQAVSPDSSTMDDGVTSILLRDNSSDYQFTLLRRDCSAWHEFMERNNIATDDLGYYNCIGAKTVFENDISKDMDEVFYDEFGWPKKVIQMNSRKFVVSPGYSPGGEEYQLRYTTFNQNIEYIFEYSFYPRWCTDRGCQNVGAEEQRKVVVSQIVDEEVPDEEIQRRIIEFRNIVSTFSIDE